MKTMIIYLLNITITLIRHVVFVLKFAENISKFLGYIKTVLE